MNLVLVFDDDFIDARHVRLRGRRFTHIERVHRAAVGDCLAVGRLNGPIGRGRVVQLHADELVMAVAFERPAPAPAAVTLLLALPRPKALRRVLQGAAAFGVKHIVVMNAWRVEKSFWESPALSADGVLEELVLGLEQGGDTVLPVVEQRRRFKPFVEDELPGLLAGTRALVAHPPAAADCPHAVSEPVTLAVGPEGGFIAYEVDLLCAHGFTPVSLGPRPLRVEQAVAALLGRILP